MASLSIKYPFYPKRSLFSLFCLQCILIQCFTGSREIYRDYYVTIQLILARISTQIPWEKAWASGIILAILQSSSRDLSINSYSERFSKEAEFAPWNPWAFQRYYIHYHRISSRYILNILRAIGDLLKIHADILQKKNTHTKLYSRVSEVIRSEIFSKKSSKNSYAVSSTVTPGNC